MTIQDSRRFNFTLIENDIIDDTNKFDKNDLLCYMVMCRYANNDTNQCFPGYETLAEKMRVSKSTAIKAVKSLVKKGVLIVTHRKNSNGGDTSNLYTIKGFNSQNKKAPSTAIEDAQENEKSFNSSNSISKSDINNTSNQKKSQCQNTTKHNIKFKPNFDINNKVLSNKHNDSVNNNFIKYGDKLEEMLFESQRGKFGDVE